MTETSTSEYSERTELNVKTGDGTLALIDKVADKGTALTIKLCKLHNKPFMIVDLSKENQPGKIIQWIQENNIHVLNVAGSRESFSPGIYQKAYSFLRDVINLPRE